ncbi:MAG: hypothetical protein MRY79_00615 [Alphaproteobacteria bacterium]|nr:hypothetical protein [Alphaproteobacteria bacterium]
MTFEMNDMIEWIDLFWVVVALVLLHGKQKIQGALFVLVCVFSLRLQIELMQEVGYPDGFVGLIGLPLLYRGFIAYGIFVAGFLSLLHLSKDDSPYIFMAASITVFIVAFCVSSFVLVL